MTYKGQRSSARRDYYIHFDANRLNFKIQARILYFAYFCYERFRFFFKLDHSKKTLVSLKQSPKEISQNNLFLLFLAQFFNHCMKFGTYLKGVRQNFMPLLQNVISILDPPQGQVLQDTLCLSVCMSVCLSVCMYVTALQP